MQAMKMVGLSLEADIQQLNASKNVFEKEFGQLGKYQALGESGVQSITGNLNKQIKCLKDTLDRNESKTR